MPVVAGGSSTAPLATVFKQEMPSSLTPHCETLPLHHDLTNPALHVPHTHQPDLLQQQQHQELTLHSATPSAALPPVASGNIARLCSRHPHIEVTLENKELWDAFYRKGTEMIVNRAGR